MKIVTRRGASLFLVNFIRQVALTQLSCTKLIAYAVGANSTVVATNDNSILEDMIEFGVNLSSYVYDIGESEYQKVELTFQDVLKLSDIEKASGIKVSNPDNLSGELLHSLKGETTVTLYFRKFFGVVSEDDNKLFLEKQGVDLTNISVVNARFCKVKSVTFGEVVTLNDQEESIEFYLEAVDGTSEEELFFEVKGLIANLFDSIDTI